MEPINKYFPRAGVYNFPTNAYGTDPYGKPILLMQPSAYNTSRPILHQGYGNGDLSQTDSRGTTMGRTDRIFTTPIPWNRQSTTIIGGKDEFN